MQKYHFAPKISLNTPLKKQLNNIIIILRLRFYVGGIMANRFKSYEPIPFWFLNDDFDPKEVILQLDTMQEIGVEALFLHVLDGNVYEGYGTELFFNNVRFIVEKAEERNIKVWLYDEDSYPSGNLGGKIVIDRPELQAHALKVIKIDAKDGGVVWAG